jgi:hypothetical protein
MRWRPWRREPVPDGAERALREAGDVLAAAQEQAGRVDEAVRAAGQLARRVTRDLRLPPRTT